MLDLSRLSPAQQQVALAPCEPVLVVAGPGSGKTTALVARVAVLVTARSVPPGRVLVLTFTTAAARELRARLIGILGRPGARVEVATFHSFGLRLVRRWRAPLGLGREGIVVYGAGDAHRLLREAAAELGLGGSRSAADDAAQQAHLATAMERYRLRAPLSSSPPDVEAGGVEADGVGQAGASVAALAQRYEGLLRARRAVDFTAMLALPLRLFEQCPDVLRSQQAAYRAVLCDEFQDVCPAQYALVRRLAETHCNLTAVGDPRQTIVRHVGAR